MDKGSRQSRHIGAHLLLSLALLASVILAVMYEKTEAKAAVTAPAPSLVTQTVATAADTQATAAPGEGVIRIVTRVCGSAGNWAAVAAANNITPPTYLVLLGQRLTVSCQPAAGTMGEARPESPPAPSSGWASPLPGACITDTYGYHSWRGYVHQGLDLGAATGTPVRAAAGGQVTRSGWIWSGYGISVTIGHGDDWTTHYAHLSSAAVGYGAWVSAGQVIGYVGSTGQVTGPHLHFEVSSSPGVLGAQRDPVPFMRDRGVTWRSC